MRGHPKRLAKTPKLNSRLIFLDVIIFPSPPPCLKRHVLKKTGIEKKFSAHH